MRFAPSAVASAAAWAAIQAKMPVVIGQPMVAPCLRAQNFAEFVDRGEFALGHSPHQGFHFAGRKDDEAALAPAFALGFIDGEDLRKTFIVRQFLPPGFPIRDSNEFRMRRFRG
jgi:hypothetical protein